jgi:hypothetical protein
VRSPLRLRACWKTLERGCVVLDQPQEARKAACGGILATLRRVFARAALLVQSHFYLHATSGEAFADNPVSIPAISRSDTT